MRSTLLFVILFFLSASHLFAQEEDFEFVNPPITIVVIGSSTAAGAGAWPIDLAWVNRYRRYVQGFNPDNQVINLAKGGYNTYHLLPTGSEHKRNRHFPDTLRNITKALEYNPDGIIVNLPSNDVSGGFSVKEQLDNFRTYAEIAKANGVELWVTTTQPRNFPKTRSRQLQSDVKDSLIQLFPDNYIDFWNGFADDAFNVEKSYDSGDGCHVNNEGHRLLTERVIQSYPFKPILIKSSFQRDISVTLDEELSPHMLNIRINGMVDFDPSNAEDTRYVKIVQYDRVLNAVEVKNTDYSIETIIDLRYDIKVEFESENGLTKRVHLDLMQFEKDGNANITYSPVTSLDMKEVQMNGLNYTFPNGPITVTAFKYDPANSMVSEDLIYAQLQQERIQDAAIFPPKEGKKRMTYWENGNKKSVLKFKNGQLNCKAKWFQENGNKERTVSFQNGAYNGKHLKYTPEGKKKEMRKFKNDQQIGNTKTY